MKKILLSVLPLLMVTSLYAGKGKIRVASDQQGAYVYIDGKKKAMTGEGFTSILLEEGEHTIKVVKSKSKYTSYIANKNIFVGEDTSIKINFKLKLKTTALKNIWQKKAAWDMGERLVDAICDDDGCVAVGYKNIGKRKSRYIWIIKFDKDGNKIWSKTFGNGNNDGGYSITNTDRGYLIAGDIGEKGDIGTRPYAWVLEIGKNGNSIWNQPYTGKTRSKAHTSVKTKDGYLIAGEKWSVKKRDYVLWMLKLDKTGKEVWQKDFADKIGGGFMSSIKTKDGYILVGSEQNYKRALILKIDSQGNKIWEKTFNDKGAIILNSVIRIFDGFIVSGFTKNSDNDWEGLVLKTDFFGKMVWKKTYGVEGWIRTYSLAQTNNGYLVVGEKNSGDSNNTDIWLMKIDINGNKIWGKTFNAKGYDCAFSIVNSGKEFILVGDKDNYGKSNKSGAWAMKFIEK